MKLERKSEHDKCENTELTYDVYGLWCSSCAMALEKKISVIKGVKKSSVNFHLAQASVTVESEATETQVQNAAREMGYSLLKPCSKTTDIEFNKTRNQYLLRLAIVLFFSMWSMAFSIAFYAGEGAIFLYLSALSSLPGIGYGAIPILKAGFVSIKARKMTFDLLFTIANLALFSVSVISLFLNLKTIFFESIVMSIGLVLLSRFIEVDQRFSVRDGVIKEKTLFDGQVELKIAEKWQTSNVQSVRSGRIVRFKKNQIVLLDGTLESNIAVFDLSHTTGEVTPVVKHQGDSIESGWILLSSLAQIKVSSPAGNRQIDSTINQAVDSASRKKQFSFFNFLIDYWAPITIVLALSKAIYSFTYFDLIHALVDFSIVLLATCPCSLIIAEPLMRLSLKRDLEKFGAKFRINQLPFVDKKIKIVFDKTGTLISGKYLTQLEIFDNRYDDSFVRKIFFKAALFAPHPTTREYLDFLTDDVDMQPTSLKIHSSLGIEFEYVDRKVRIGKPTWFNTRDGNLNYVNFVEIDGYLVAGQKAVALPTVSNISFDGLKTFADSFAVLTGDNKLNLGLLNASHFSEIHTDCTTEKKREYIQNWKKDHFVVYIGDGINDLLALSEADLAISVNSKYDSINSVSSIVLSTDNLKHLDKILTSVFQSSKRLKKSFMLGLVYNLVVVSFALSGQIHPLLAVSMMTVSSLLISAYSFKDPFFKINTTITKKEFV